jgi:hypothetical protein
MKMTLDRFKGDSGSIAPLGIGLFMFIVAMMFAIISASSMFIFQKRLTTLAEAAAVFSSSSGESSGVFIEKAPQRGFTNLKIDDELLQDDRTTEVVACALWVPPLRLLGTLGTKEICSHAAARASG